VLPLTEPLARQHSKFVLEIGNDPYISDTTIGIGEVLDAHFLIADFFAARGQDFVAVGPASLPLLHSALSRQFVTFAGQAKWKTPHEIAATLLFGLIKDHAFHDANKRTALVSTMWLLMKQKLGPATSQQVLEDFVVEIADDQLPTKYARCRESKAAGDPDAEVSFIAYWLKQNTRTIQHEQRVITYRELRTILRRFGFQLENPKDNYIDVVRVSYRKGFLGIGEGETRQKIGRIGYPSETRQMTKGDIKKVRELCDLDFKYNFVDSQEFYDGINPMSFLLNEYQDILIRLADR
jgi:death-on-curing family protein